MTGDPTTERELLEGCRAGDPRAARELVQRHQKGLLRLVLRLVGRGSVAEEMVQEAFLRLFRDIDRIDASRGARQWLLTTTLNLVRNHHRTEARSKIPRDAEPETLEFLSYPPRDPDQALAQVETVRRLESALQELPPPLREVVVLHYVEGLPFQTLASMLGTPVVALRMRALRARRRLRTLLEDLA